MKKVISLVLALFICVSFTFAHADTYKRNLVDFCQTFFVRLQEWNEIHTSDKLSYSYDMAYVKDFPSLDEYIISCDYATVCVEKSGLDIQSVNVTLFEIYNDDMDSALNTSAIVMSAIEYSESEDTLMRVKPGVSKSTVELCSNFIRNIILRAFDDDDVLEKIIIKGESVLVYSGKYYWFVSFREAESPKMSDRIILEGRAKD